VTAIGRGQQTNGRREFWSANQPGFRFTDARPGSREFFAQIERHRYELEPHIPAVVDFPRWDGKDVLEAGCGMATDGLQFARSGATYTGCDFSEDALALAGKRFALEQVSGRFVRGSVTELPFADESFDLVYSHGVIHHVPDTERAVREIRRVLRPGGVALVMLYHRRSLNYLLTIMVVRRALAATLMVPGLISLLARVTGETPALLQAHRALLRRHGTRYLSERSLFLSNNTDGPGNPLSKVYSREQARKLFEDFAPVSTKVRFLNLRIYPFGARVAATKFGRSCERRAGWHLYVAARKPAAGDAARLHEPPKLGFSDDV
jgi:ubiquinone/menaquinone biosynthesis C-methylase UbiE